MGHRRERPLIDKAFRKVGSVFRRSKAAPKQEASAPRKAPNFFGASLEIRLKTTQIDLKQANICLIVEKEGIKRPHDAQEAIELIREKIQASKEMNLKHKVIKLKENPETGKLEANLFGNRK